MRQPHPLRRAVEHFYPRPPRGGRPLPDVFAFRLRHISIHALREEGDRLVLLTAQRSCGISIHALREEGDRYARDGAADIFEFLSTPSARRAT